MEQYASDVQQLVQRLFAQEPFREYKRYFNVHRIDVISPQSGADPPERHPPVLKDTALDATYDCGSIQRLICVNDAKVLTIASDSLETIQRDLLFVLVNDPEYGGSGGAITVVSSHPDVAEIALHELGHSFGLLADEYGGAPSPACDASIEPPEPNVTKRRQRTRIKWNAWIAPSTPIPTLTPVAGVPGLYEGAKYCDNGLFRPTFNSKMRSLGMPFEQINTERLIKRIYHWISPLDESRPRRTRVKLTRGQKQTFKVSTLQPVAHTLNVTCLVDGQRQRTSTRMFILNSATLSLGTHTVEVIVEDPTPQVRSDPNELLTERRIWTVSVR